MAITPDPAANALPAQVGPEELVMQHGLPADEVQRRLEAATRLVEAERRTLALGLAEMEARRLYLETGHVSTAHYAQSVLEIDRRRTAELLRLGRTLRAPAQECPPPGTTREPRRSDAPNVRRGRDGASVTP